MKKDTHPTYFKDAKIICACGNTFTTGSTKKELHTELCSNCHPFFTGQQKIIDSAGRVDKFRAKMEKAKKLQEQSANAQSNKAPKMKVIEDVTDKKAA